jgi:hypothetical protein
MDTASGDGVVESGKNVLVNYETEDPVYVIKLKTHSGNAGNESLVNVRKLME